MQTTRFFRSVLAVSLVAVLSGYGLAAGRSDYETRDELSLSEDTSRQEVETSQMQDGVVLRRASKVIGKPLKDTHGRTIGTIHDLVLTEDLDRVSYAALSTGGIFGLGRQLHAVPWSAIQLGIGDTLVAPIDEYELKQTRGFREAYWPSEGNPRWAGRPGERTEEVTFGPLMAADQESIRSRRVSRIKGTTVEEPRGRNVGDIQDLIIAMDSGRVVYTIVSYGGVLGLGQRFSAVPMGAITLQPERRIARLAVDEQVLRVNSFSPGQFPNLSDAVYARNIHQAYNQEPDWVVLGYVAPEEPPTAPAAERPAARPAAPAMRETPPRSLAEPTEAELTGTFDASRVATVEATVTDLGKYRCSRTGLDMLWLRLRTNDGRIVTVNAGPRDYIAKQDFYIVRGDRIRLTGSEVAATAAGKRVFLPTEIVFGTHTLRVADASGRPLWEAQMREAGRPGETLPAESQPQSREPTPEKSDVLGYVPAEGAEHTEHHEDCAKPQPESDE